MAPAASAHWTIEATRHSALAICSHCQARFIAATRRAVMVELAEHMRRGHLARADRACTAATAAARLTVRR